MSVYPLLDTIHSAALGMALGAKLKGETRRFSASPSEAWKKPAAA